MDAKSQVEKVLDNKVVCVDLDGTLIRTNSFPKWILYSLKCSIMEVRLSLAMQLIYLLFFRKAVPLLSHVTFKGKINNLSYPEGWSQSFCELLHSNYRSDAVVSQILSLAADQVVVTTAAPFCYAQSLVNVFSFGDARLDVLCSHQKDHVFYDNYQQNKKVFTLAHIGNREFYLFTDHRDDIAIAECAKQVFLCNPSPRDRAAFDLKKIQYNLILDENESN